MGKLYFLPVALLLSFTALSQDIANFQVSIGAGNTVFFVNTSVVNGPEPRKAHWFFGDGTKQVTPPLAGTQHQYAAAGTYSACLKIYKYNSTFTDSIVTADICKTINLQPANIDSCKAAFSDTAATSSALQKKFIAQPWHIMNKKPEKICWTFGNGDDTCVTYNPLVPQDYVMLYTYAQPGTYHVCVTIKYQGGCQATHCRLVTVGATTVITCSAQFTTEPVTATPFGRKFTAIPGHSQQKKPVKVCWIFGDGQDTCINYPLNYTGAYQVHHNYNAAGQYNACVKIFYEGGCTKQYCNTVNVTQTGNNDCFVSLFQSPATSTNNVRNFLVGLNPNKVAEKICWYFGDGQDTCIFPSNPPTQQQLSIEHQYPAPGNYQTCVKVWYSGGCVVQKCTGVQIGSSNGSTMCGGYIMDSVVAPKTIHFKGFSIHGPNDNVVSWFWTFGDGTTSNVQNPTHAYLAGGQYNVCLTVKTQSGCITKICKKVVVHPLPAAQLTLAPNPVQSALQIMFQSTHTQPVTIKIYNATGVAVSTYTMNAVMGTNIWTINVGTLPAGSYTVMVYSPNQFATAGFFKQ
ncbi:MAG TPA: PKD domain-containing protein [Flavisolibacter sp.]